MLSPQKASKAELYGIAEEGFLHVVQSIMSNHWKANKTSLKMKKRLEETQTLRAGFSKAEPKISPHCRPPSRGRRNAKI